MSQERREREAGLRFVDPTPEISAHLRNHIAKAIGNAVPVSPSPSVG